MTDLRLQRCLNHPNRQAGARCPVCAKHFCRECVTEHENRMVCAACLARLGTKPEVRHNRLAWLPGMVQCAVAFFALWLLFYAAGRLLLALPEDIHEGTVWAEPWLERE